MFKWKLVLIIFMLGFVGLSDPVFARFVSVDPIGAAQYIKQGNVHGFNRYAYGNNNPYKYTDPSGEAAESWLNRPNGISIQQHQDSYTGAAMVGTAVFSVGVSAVSVPLGLALEATALATGDIPAIGGKTFQTYTKINSKTGQIYSGRTSGKGTPEQNIARRDVNHHMNKDGYGPAILDKSSSSSAAIRGREQQLIDAHGGAQSTGGMSGNKINGISNTNNKRESYIDAANKEFDK